MTTITKRNFDNLVNRDYSSEELYRYVKPYLVDRYLLTMTGDADLYILEDYQDNSERVVRLSVDKNTWMVAYYSYYNDMINPQDIVNKIVPLREASAYLFH